MGSIAVNKTQKRGRTTIRISLTPKNPQTRALLRKFKTEVARFEKKWKAIIKARKKKLKA